jgi:TM2 domain-containing membrane protein YozV
VGQVEPRPSGQLFAFLRTAGRASIFQAIYQDLAVVRLAQGSDPFHRSDTKWEYPVQPLKNPGVAAVLSFLFTGLGQIYNGQIAKGIAFVIVGFLNWLLLFVFIGFITLPIFWIYNIYDAYKRAEMMNRRQAGEA